MKNKNLIISLAVSIGVFCVYLFTLAPSVIQIDSGELAAAQILPGIAHPSGYPLFSLLGYLFSKIPLGTSLIYQMNILAAVYVAASIFMFFNLCLIIIDKSEYFVSRKIKKEKYTKKNKKGKTTTGSETVVTSIKLLSNFNEIYIVVILSIGILAFSKTFWFQSTSVEVYSLHVLNVNLLIYFLIRAYFDKNMGFSKYWYFFAIALAASFGNHLTTMLVLPATAYLYFSKNRFSKAAFVNLAKMIGLFLFVLVLIYSYFPLVASSSPLLNWGNPIDLERILRHISGKQYQVWIFSSFDSAKKQLTYFINNLPKEFGISLALVLAGVVYTFLNLRKAFYFISILFVSTLFYSINYDIVDIDAYFLLAYISMGLWGLFGVVFVFNLLKDRTLKLVLPIFLIAVLIIIQIYFNFSRVNQSGNYIFEDYTKNALASVEKNSIIFSYQWDYFISPAYYFQFVENYRKDICIIDKELLRRSWYYNQIRTGYPKVLEGIKPTEEQFLYALKPFEQDGNFDANLLENLYRKIMTDLISTNVRDREYYIGPELIMNELGKGEFTLPTGYKIIPHLFFFKVVEGNEYDPAPDYKYSIRIPTYTNNYVNFIKENIPAMLVRRALYEMQFDKRDRAKHYISAIRKYFPEYILPKGVADVIEN